MTLDDLKKLAKDTPNADILVWRKKSNPKTENVIWDQIHMTARTAYANMSLPFEKKSSGWKNIFLSKPGMGQVEPQPVKFDQNSLSDPALIELLAANGFEKKENSPTKSEDLVVKKTPEDLTDDEVFELARKRKAAKKLAASENPPTNENKTENTEA